MVCHISFDVLDGQRVLNGRRRLSTVHRMMPKISFLVCFNTILWSGLAQLACTRWRSTSSLRVSTGTACYDRRLSLYLTCRMRKIQATSTVSWCLCLSCFVFLLFHFLFHWPILLDLLKLKMNKRNKKELLMCDFLQARFPFYCTAVSIRAFEGINRGNSFR